MKRLLHLIASIALLSAAACRDSPARTLHNGHPPAAPVVPPAIPLAGRVTDAAHILPAAEIARLSAKLEQLDRSTSHQMVVVTAPSLGGRDISDFTRDLGNQWGIGRKGYDDGVILLVAPNQRRVRIAVGDGLRRTLPDGLCRQIIDRVMIARFRNRDFAGGIEAGTDEIIARLSMNPPIAEPSTSRHSRAGGNPA